MVDSAKKADLVLEGGGVKGIGLLGAVLTLHDAGYTFPRLAGTSAGAIVAALVAAYQRAGKDLHQLEAVMREVEYTRFRDGSLLERLTGRLGEGADLLLHEGMHSGAYLKEWLGPLLEETGITKFSDLRVDDPGSSLKPYQAYSLVVHASDLSRGVLVRLPWDYEEYGLDPNTELIVDAVRASMSIPFYFQPVQVPTDRGTATWVDGGLLSNFPITVFDRTDGRKPRWPTWGVQLSGEPSTGPDRSIKTAMGIAVRCLETLTGDWNRYRLQQDGVTSRVMHVATAGVSAVDFSITPETRDQLFAAGQQAAHDFLALQEKAAQDASAG